MIEGGTSDFRSARVPFGYDLAAAWAWRFIVIAAAGAMILWALRFFAVVTLPLVIALFFSALLNPVVSRLERVHVPRKLAALITVIVGIAVVATLLTFVGQQVSSGIGSLSSQVVHALRDIRDWLQTGPLHLSNQQFNSFIGHAQNYVENLGKKWAGQITEVTSAVGHIVAGLFIVLFSTYFFMADGAVIWAWLVRLFPRTARVRADSSGRIAYRSLTQFVRATVLVAATDAIGIMIWAAVLGLPFIGAIGVLVFLGAFVPMIGATISGVVAVLVALVAKGPVTALVMAAGVIVVQQIEAHVLQPFLMGRLVAVHPLGIIVAIGMGILVAGIPGGVIAVPLAAALNAVVLHLASFEHGEEEPSPVPEPEVTP